MFIQKEYKKAFIKSFRRQGYKYVQVAKIFGVSRQRIEQILRPERHQARLVVNGSRLKPLPCEYPGCGNKKTEAHHFDYTKPLEVNWLCVRHHKEFHSKPKEEKIEIPKKCLDCQKLLPNKIAIRCKNCSVIHTRLVENKNRRVRYKNNLEFRAKVYERNLNWRKSNPERWNEICRKASNKYYLKKKMLG